MKQMELTFFPWNYLPILTYCQLNTKLIVCIAVKLN